jgi:hypothetical protein
MEAFGRRLIRAFWFTLAILFLVESWLWDNVKIALVRLASALGLKELETRLRGFIASLSPMATLAIFALPAITIFPLKLLAVAAIAHGHVIAGISVILAAKTLALGVTSFLFDASREKLLQIGWFVKLYETTLRVSRWAHARVEPFKQRIREAKDFVKARLSRALGEEGRSLFLRKLALLRALVRRRGV